MNRKSNSIWFILLIVILILLFFLWLSRADSKSFETDEDEIDERKRREEELLKELEELETEFEILERHKFSFEFTDKYLERISVKRYKQMIRLMILLAIGINAGIYFLVAELTLLELIGWNGAILLGLNVLLALCFVHVKKAKEDIKEYLKAFIDSRVYKNRDTNYYEEKILFYESEIKRIKVDRLNKENEIRSLRL